MLQSQAKNRANPNRSEVQANLSLFLEAASGFYTQVRPELRHLFSFIADSAVTGPDSSVAVSVSISVSIDHSQGSVIHTRELKFPCVQLLQELCTVFNVDLPCRVKSSQLGIIGNQQGGGGGAIVTPQPSSCSYICQHCLVHLGDIGEGALARLSSERRPNSPQLTFCRLSARYRNQTSQAESYYRHAAQLVPSNGESGLQAGWCLQPNLSSVQSSQRPSTCVLPPGQPYNQLAILASSKGDHLTTIFYYCRSIAVKFPFPAASTNLQKALSKALER